MKRNILTLRDKSYLCNSDKLLYDPYKNIVTEFYKLATDKGANAFDVVAREFNGINRAEINIRHYYEALLGVTSYFQASKGGRGKYIEKKLASVSDTCSLDNKISELPKLILHTNLVRKHKLFGQKRLSNEEKESLRLCEWDFIGNSRNKDQTTDLCNLFIDEHLISYLELKNRVDSGGTSARREIFDNKFRGILEHFINPNPIFKLRNKEYTLPDFYQHFGLKKIKIALGILFDTEGNIATKESDQRFGFYSSSKEGFANLLVFLRKNNLDTIYTEESLFIRLKSDFSIEIKNLYGNQISEHLFHKKIDLNSLIKNKYDDIWLFQLLTIDERHHLLKYNKNVTLELTRQIEADFNFRKVLNDFINQNGKDIKILEFFINKLQVDKKLIPTGRNIKEYLTDVLYFISANDT